MIFNLIAALQGNPGGGTTDPPTGTTYRTSTSGLVSDASLAVGSTTFGTNNTAAMQALLDLGGHADNPITIIIDGHYSIGQVQYLSYTTLQFETGCGFILRDGTNKVMFRPKNYSFTTYTTTNFYVEGAGIINGNLANAGHTEPYNVNENPEANPSVVAQKKFVAGEGIIFCFVLWGVENFHIKDIEIRRPRTYHMMLSRCRNFLIDNVTCDRHGAQFGYNNDGIQLRGNCSNGIMSNLTISAGDDGIPINADDVNAYYSHEFYQDGGGNLLISGPVEDITYTDVEFPSSIFALRLLSGASLIDNISYAGLSGQCNERWLVADKYEGAVEAGNGNIGTVTINGVDILVLDRQFPEGEGQDADVVWSANAARVNLYDIKRRVYIDDLWATFKFYDGGIIQRVDIDDYVANDLAANPYRATGKDIPHIIVDGAQINELYIRRAVVSKLSTENNSCLIKVINGGVIQKLWIEDCLIDDIARLVWIVDGYVDVIRMKTNSHTNASGNASIDIDSHTVQYLASEAYTGSLLSSGTVGTTSADADAAIPGGITYHTV